ncbi:hypothetical protein [Microbacterium sp.]|uniref:hypothetical protein n=1 Tax=Microbacterium sp. TaxID=51671 RepID=UPI0027349CDD|nr:hypothetical protein [Microbacterium sp.]MDP3952611.1 hypothetical protein [Microbacterium sp.]
MNQNTSADRTSHSETKAHWRPTALILASCGLLLAAVLPWPAVVLAVIGLVLAIRNASRHAPLWLTVTTISVALVALALAIVAIIVVAQRLHGIGLFNGLLF